MKNSYKAPIFSQIPPLCAKFSHFSRAFSQLVKASSTPTWTVKFFLFP
nr:MAG TPA: hypothetical protein [Caudoviricetes sp.]